MANQNETWRGSGQEWENAWNTGTQGLDTNNITGGIVGGIYHQDTPGFGGTNYQATADKYNQSYSDPSGGGTFTRTGQSFGGKTPTLGSWTSASGETVNDLAGYIGMKKAQKSGSDFSGYQSGINSALNEQGGWNHQYKDLIQDPNKIQQTAGYQFALDQGNQAINRSAAAKGMLNSGNVLAELAKYGQGMASQEYDKQLGRIQTGSSMSGNQVNSMMDLMHGAQKFGIDSGYYPQGTPNAPKPYGANYKANQNGGNHG